MWVGLPDQLDKVEVFVPSDNLATLRRKANHVPVAGLNVSKGLNVDFVVATVVPYAQVLSSESDVDHDLRIELPVDCEPFTARFDNLLTGWVGTVRLQTSNTLDLCAAAFA